MVGIQGYATISMGNLIPGTGTVHPGGFNTASALQDANNINAGLIRVNFNIPFRFPPTVTVQPIRAQVLWESPGNDPFHLDGENVHRDVFPLPPPLAIDGQVDEILDVPVARVHEASGGQPTASRIETENKLLECRLMFIERTHFVVQFAGYVGKSVRVRPFTLEGIDAATDVQHGTVSEILFSYMAAGDLEV